TRRSSDLRLLLAKSARAFSLIVGQRPTKLRSSLHGPIRGTSKSSRCAMATAGAPSLRRGLLDKIHGASRCPAELMASCTRLILIVTAVRGGKLTLVA